MDLTERVKKFNDKRVAVVGDVMLDLFKYGDVRRISPEGPYPVLRIKSKKYDLGGAANVAANAVSLGGGVCLIGAIGKDENGDILEELLRRSGIECSLVKNSQTTLKTRLVARGQQVWRVDEEDDSKIRLSGEFKKRIYPILESADMILVSDYAKGFVTHELFSFLEPWRNKIIVDPKPQNKNIYGKVRVITPNEEEALTMSGKRNVTAAGRALRKKFGCNILVTRGENGMMIFSDKELEIPTYAREVFDVTGAGDSADAALGLAIASGASLEEAAIIANYTAGIAVSKAGTYAVKQNELIDSILGKRGKIKTLVELEAIVENQRRLGKNAVWTNGCFDLAHGGHVKYLRAARTQGDYLILGLNSDASVRKLKGAGRPVLNQEERAEVMSSMEFVDHVTIFDADSPIEYIRALKPEVYAKGGDYNLNSISQEERAVVENYGGKIVLIPTGVDTHTTKLIERLNGKE